MKMEKQNKKVLSALIRLTKRKKDSTFYFSPGIIKGESSIKGVYVNHIHTFLSPYIHQGIVDMVNTVIPNGKPRVSYRVNLEKLAEGKSDYYVTKDTLAETAVDELNLADDTQLNAMVPLEEIEGDTNLDSFGSDSGLLDLSLQADDTTLGGILDEIYISEEEPTIKGDINLDSFGSGSGLLDLSLKADDTTLGGILDEIYTAEQDQELSKPNLKPETLSVPKAPILEKPKKKKKKAFKRFLRNLFFD